MDLGEGICRCCKSFASLAAGIHVQENFDKRGQKKAQITVPLRHFFPLKVVPLIEVLLYTTSVHLS
jgi:hypothetical protein